MDFCVVIKLNIKWLCLVKYARKLEKQNEQNQSAQSEFNMIHVLVLIIYLKTWSQYSYVQLNTNICLLVIIFFESKHWSNRNSESHRKTLSLPQHLITFLGTTPVSQRLELLETKRALRPNFYFKEINNKYRNR